MVRYKRSTNKIKQSCLRKISSWIHAFLKLISYRLPGSCDKGSNNWQNVNTERQCLLTDFDKICAQNCGLLRNERIVCVSSLRPNFELIVMLCHDSQAYIKIYKQHTGRSENVPLYENVSMCYEKLLLK